MTYSDVIFEREPDYVEVDPMGGPYKAYTGLYAVQECYLTNPAGHVTATYWHALVTEEQWEDIFNNWPANKRPKNPVAAKNKYFRQGAGPNNWKSLHAFGPGQDKMTDRADLLTEAKELRVTATKITSR